MNCKIRLHFKTAGHQIYTLFLFFYEGPKTQV